MSGDPAPRTPDEPSDDQHVVLLDERGRPSGTVSKVGAHHGSTPLHLGFSCHITGPDGLVLLSRRAHTKTTWPGIWSNGCCGHPLLGETLRESVTRRLDEELGLAPLRIELLMADFAYRATMTDGTAEHELCPVVALSVAGPSRPEPTEVDDVEWITWGDLTERARRDPESLSPWCVEQVGQLNHAGLSPMAVLGGDAAPGSQGLLDTRIELHSPLIRDGGRVDPRQGAAVPARSPERSPEVESIAEPLADVLNRFVDRGAREFEDIDPEVVPIAEEVRSLIQAGGKRLRPAFVYWGHRATGADHDPAVLEPAVAIELLHTFALIHDDVMDGSTTRRGRPSAFQALGELHRRSDLVGDGDRFGASAAILAGDLAFVWADQLFDSSTLPPQAIARARQVFSTLRIEVLAGQYLDLVTADDPTASEDRAHWVALLKSARYTVTRPLLLGAALADETSAHQVQAALSTYGDAVGMAFQLRDDILGLFGDPAITGKATLDDLRGGKRTILIHRALRLCDDDDRKQLLASLGDPELGPEGAARCRDVVAASGALAAVEMLIAHQHQIALDAVTSLSDPARAALEEMAALAIDRQA